MPKYFIYGSLRKGEYNHALLKNSAKYVSYGVLSGYSMVSLGFYPAIFRNQGGTVVGEIYEINDKITQDRLDSMELGAGYHKITVIAKGEDKPHVCFVYVMDEEVCKRKERVIGGDWCKRSEETFI